MPMPRINVELNLPFLTIGVDDVKTAFKRGRRASGSPGPFIIIARSCGKGLDTAYAANPGHGVIVWAAHGQPQQLWTVKPSGHEGEVLIVSASNGLALDATDQRNEDPHPEMSEPDGSATQRWRLAGTPDGVGYRIQSTSSQLFLSSNDGAQDGWRPWFEPLRRDMSQQWIFALPYGVQER